MSRPSYETRIEKAIQRIVDADESGRAPAATALHHLLVSNNLHPSDLNVTVRRPILDQQYELLEYLKTENQKLYRQLEFVRRHLSEDKLKELIQQGEIDYLWFEFEDLVRTKVTGDADGKKLRSGWQTMVCASLVAFGVTNGMINRWMRGREQIPSAILESLRELPNAEPKRGTEKAVPVVDRPEAQASSGRERKAAAEEPKQERRGHREDYYPWDDLTVEIATSGFEKGWTNGTIAEEVSKVSAPCTQNQVNQLIYNNAPRHPISVQPTESSEPLSWLEAWEIAGRIWGRGWKTTLLRELGMRKSELFAPPHPINAPASKIKELRRNYHDHIRQQLAGVEKHQERLRAGASNALYQEILSAGASGATVWEVGMKLGWNERELHSATSRTSELSRRLDIFQVGRDVARHGAVWVAREFKDRWPDQWRIAEQNYVPGSTSR